MVTIVSTPFFFSFPVQGEHGKVHIFPHLRRLSDALAEHLISISAKRKTNLSRLIFQSAEIRFSFSLDFLRILNKLKDNHLPSTKTKRLPCHSYTTGRKTFFIRSTSSLSTSPGCKTKVSRISSGCREAVTKRMSCKCCRRDTSSLSTESFVSQKSAYAGKGIHFSSGNTFQSGA